MPLFHWTFHIWHYLRKFWGYYRQFKTSPFGLSQMATLFMQKVHSSADKFPLGLFGYYDNDFDYNDVVVDNDEVTMPQHPRPPKYHNNKTKVWSCRCEVSLGSFSPCTLTLLLSMDTLGINRILQMTSPFLLAVLCANQMWEIFRDSYF